MTIITISRQFGSGGDEIAARVCEILGYKTFDKQLIVQAAEEVGLTDQEIANYSEENHKVRSFIDRLLGRSQVVIRDSLQAYDLTEETTVSLVQKAIFSAAEVGNVVIVGRGGQVILKDHPNVIHVRIEAPLDVRIKRSMEDIRNTNKGTYHPDYEVRKEAQAAVIQKDAASRDYLQRYYQVDWNDPTLYHVILNTGKLTIEQAAQMIINVVQNLQNEPEWFEQIIPAA